MTESEVTGEREDGAPIEILEQYFDARAWPCERSGDGEIVAYASGSWAQYELRGVWRPEDQVLQFLAFPDIKVAPEKRPAIYESLGLINEQLWLGHFEMWSGSGLIVFRHSTVLDIRDGEGLTLEQAEAIAEAALEECERFYPVFQFVLWGGKSPGEAMAGAMIEGWRSAGVDLSLSTAIRPSGKPFEGVRTVASLKDAGAAPRMIVLGFKPQHLDEVAPDLAPWITSKTIIVSILAGVESESLRQRFRKGIIVRAAPNLPVSVRRGVVALYSEDLDADARKPLSELFAALGFAMWTEGEKALAAISAVAGAGPAYVARFIDALADAGVKQGLPEALAGTIALETVFGTAWMAAASGETMDEVARRIASPEGTTEAGLAVLDREGAFQQLIGATIEAARRRGAELAAKARGEQVA